MTLLIGSVVSLLLAIVPAAMLLSNWRLFTGPVGHDHDRGNGSPTVSDKRPLPRVSLLIPARDEACGVSTTLEAAARSEQVDLQIIVLDDHSTDATAEIVRQIAHRDNRVRLLQGSALPAGWNGKQFACYQLALAADGDYLAFMDADVHLMPDALGRLVAHRQASAVPLVSAFPYQRTGTLLEKMLIPMMHVILLGFLPIRRMRQSTHPAYAAGCGQLMVTDPTSYRIAGTHQAIRGSRHDGLTLPRAFRLASLATDVVDGSQIAECRMYRSAGQVVRGLLKNAVEGMANPRRIVPFTVVLIGGMVAPPVLAVAAWAHGNAAALSIAVFACVLAWLPRVLAAVRFGQSILGVVLHPLAVLILVALQWIALAQHLTGRTVTWRGRC